LVTRFALCLLAIKDPEVHEAHFAFAIFFFAIGCLSPSISHTKYKYEMSLP